MAEGRPNKGTGETTPLKPKDNNKEVKNNKSKGKSK